MSARTSHGEVSSAQQGRVRGRPRNADLDERVLCATRELLAAEGYSKLAIDQVARLAGVTRATIYRRWPTKLELVHSAVFPASDAIPDLGADRLAANVRHLVELGAASYGSPVARAAVPGLLADFQQQPDLSKRIRDPLRRAAKDRFASVVEAAHRRGEVRPEVDASAAFDALVGAVFFRLAHGEALSKRDYRSIADVVLYGISTDRSQLPH